MDRYTAKYNNNAYNRSANRVGKSVESDNYDDGCGCGIIFGCVVLSVVVIIWGIFIEAPRSCAKAAYVTMKKRQNKEESDLTS